MEVLETVGWSTLRWVNGFNKPCLLEPIGNIAPAEAEARYYVLARERQLAA